jgi:[ribosomal protein S5]-alanine N-acetyltransferase
VVDPSPTLPVVIETTRLRLVALTGVAAHAVAHGDRATDWHDEFPTDDDREAAAMVSRDPAGATNGWSCRQVERVADGTIIGTIGFKSPPASIEGRLEAEVGYGLVPSARGAGLATEALAAIVDATDRAGVEVIATVEVGNAASLRVLDKCGFVPTRSISGHERALRRPRRPAG